MNHLIKISKKEYYHKYFESNNKNIKNIWTGIKQIINIKPVNSGLPSKIVLQNREELADSKQIATAFNEYFANIGNNIASSIPQVNMSAMSYLPTRQPASFFLYPTTTNEIEEEIDNLKSSKATQDWFL